MIGAPTNLDLEIVVSDVADRFQREWGVVVTGAARNALLEPARQHQQQIEEELSEGRITLEFLEDAILQVLSVARMLAREELKKQSGDVERRVNTKGRREKSRVGKDRRGKRHEIEERHVLESMKKDCPYIPWC